MACCCFSTPCYITSILIGLVLIFVFGIPLGQGQIWARSIGLYSCFIGLILIIFGGVGCLDKMIKIFVAYRRRKQLATLLQQQEPRQANDIQLPIVFRLQNQCVVCLSRFQPNQVIFNLSCGHRFHHSCINDEIWKQTNCPVCRIVAQ